MSVLLKDRPIESVRSDVIDQLIMNYSHNQLSFEAFERRLDQAMASADHDELLALVEDLSLAVDKDYVENKKRDLGIRLSSVVDDEPEEQDTIVNVFSGGGRSGVWHVPRKLVVYSVFSGSSIDFSEARFSSNKVTIELFSLFSGDTLYMPEHINVVTKAFSIFGSIHNKTSTQVDRNAPVVIIKGYSIFSGISIKVKKTMKQRFVEFADELKKMFS